MNSDWCTHLLLRRLAEGYTLQQAATSGKISRQAVWKRMKASPEFAEAVVAARAVGKDEREFRIWLRHPFRGKRPPTGKGHGGKPVFTYGLGARSRRAARG